MKVTLLGIVAILSPLLGLSPANAATYTYAVDYMIGPATVTGSITTTCDSCVMTISDVTAWSFFVPSLSLSISGTAPVTATGVIDVTPMSIVWNPDTGHTVFLENLTGCVDFDGVDCSASFPSAYDASNQMADISISTSPITIATSTATPLPAALPLFATGLGALGLFGWRRKRKASAIAA
jgi:hypothetical protein